VCSKTLRGKQLFAEMSRNDKDLVKLRKEIARTRISICDPSRNGNYVKLQGKTPVCTMIIPNSLQIAWRKYRTLENNLGRPPTDFVELANWSLDGLILKKGVASIETRLSTENGRFHSQYSKLGGAQRQTLALKVTKMLVVLSETVPVTASGTQQVTAAAVMHSQVRII